jgi:hypothetical protein
VKKRAVVAVTVLVLAACATQRGSAPRVASLGEDRAARVGPVEIPARLVGSVAGARSVGVRDAVDDLVNDALLSVEATARGLDRSPDASWACRAAAARWVASSLLDEARRHGEPKDDELATVEVIHAIVLRSAVLAPSRGEALAEQVRQAVAAVPTLDEHVFASVAQHVHHAGAQMTVEKLEPFDASGRSANGTLYDAAFAAGAFALDHPGETSPVVASPFGWHVIRLVARSVPAGDVLAERRRSLNGAVVDMRVREELRAALSEARRRSRVDVAPQADALMADVVRAP